MTQGYGRFAREEKMGQAACGTQQDSHAAATFQS